MNFTIQAKPLATALALLASVTDRRNTIPALACVLIEAREGGEVDLTATNMDAFVSLRLQAQVDVPGAWCIPAVALRDATKKLAKDAQATFIYKEEERPFSSDGPARTVQMTAGRARMSFPAISTDEFPNPRAMLERHEAADAWEAETGNGDTRADGLEPSEGAARILAKFAKHVGEGAAQCARFDVVGDRLPRFVAMREDAIFGCIIDKREAAWPKASPFNLDAGLYVEVEGERTEIATRSSGVIALSAEQVAAMCGPVDPSTFVTIPDVVFHRGRVVAIDGIAIDGSGRRFNGQRFAGWKDSGKRYCLSDAEFEAAWLPAGEEAPAETVADVPDDICAGPLCKGVPWPEVLEEAAIASAFGLQMLDDVVSVVNWGREGKFQTRIPARHQERARELFAEQTRTYAASLDVPIAADPLPAETEKPAEPTRSDKPTRATPGRAKRALEMLTGARRGLGRRVFDDCFENYDGAHVVARMVATIEGEGGNYQATTDAVTRYRKMMPTPPETPASAQEAIPTPATLPPAMENAPSAAPADEMAAIEPTEAQAMEQAGDVIGALIAELQARVDRLEAVALRRETETVGPSVVEKTHTVAETHDFTRARRLRIVRCYLAMRARRDLDRRALLAANEQYRKVEAREEDYRFTIADLSTRLAAATERANSADAKWSSLIDAKQARIVQLENAEIERLSGGRIVMPGYGKATVRLASVGAGR